MLIYCGIFFFILVLWLRTHLFKPNYGLLLLWLVWPFIIRIKSARCSWFKGLVRTNCWGINCAIFGIILVINKTLFIFWLSQSFSLKIINVKIRCFFCWTLFNYRIIYGILFPPFCCSRACYIGFYEFIILLGQQDQWVFMTNQILFFFFALYNF